MSATPELGTGPTFAATVAPATTSDAAALRALLAEAGLPRAGFAAALEAGEVMAARDAAGRLLGCAALERYGPAVLLRSVAVNPSRRRRGIGRTLVAAALDRARAGGAREAYLLTETAGGFFARLGWERCERSAVPPAVAASVEFTSACPASAVAMRRPI